MGEPNRTRRRIVLAAVGAVSGLLSGLGALIVLTQGGRIDPSLEVGLPLWAIITGGIIGYLDLPKTGNRLVSLLVVVASLGVMFLGFAEPATAQQDCGLVVTAGGTQEDILSTSENRPLTIDLESARQLAFTATAEGVDQGTVDVSVLSISPFGFLVEPGGTVLYYSTIEGGISAGTLDIEQAGVTGFVASGDGFESPILPMGLLELSITMSETPSGFVRCQGTAWLRLVAQPASNLIGVLGLALSGLGLIGFGWIHVAKERDRIPVPRPTPVLSPPAPPPPPPPPPIPKPLRRIPTVATKPAVAGPWIEASGSAGTVRYAESRFLDSQGNPVDFDAALVEGRQYSLELTLRPGVREKDPDGSVPRDLKLSGWSAGVEIEPVIQFGFAGSPLSLEIPIMPRRSGRQEIALDLTWNGHLLLTERINLSIAEADQAPSEALPQTTRSVHSGGDLSAYDLSQRRPRALLVILESDADGSVDVRARDRDGGLVVAFDSRVKPEALAEAANDVRKQLRRVLSGGPGIERHVSRDQLERALVFLVKTGRQLHRALFPPGSVVAGSLVEMENHVVAGGTIQVIQNESGLGNSTLPWNLIYDHAFLPRTERNRLCPDFPRHRVDECPYREDEEVMCPTGFWGYRAIVEEPWLVNQRPLVTSGRGPSAVGYLDAGLSDADRQATALGALGVQRVEDFDALLDQFRNHSGELGLLYFYGHHARDRETGTPGISIGRELLSSLSFDAITRQLSGSPLIILNGCESGAYAPTEPLSLIDEFRRLGAAGVITTECTVWDPLAGSLGEHMVTALAGGSEIGEVLLALRRRLLSEDNNVLGLAYRLQALSETTARFVPLLGEVIELDLTAEDRAELPSGGPT